jgi:outer membrane receptor protein involved in Fe transport
MLSFFDNKLNNTFNYFLNNTTDLVYNNTKAVAPAPAYENSGKVKITGIEEELSYVYKMLKFRFNGTWQHVIDWENYRAVGDEIINVPAYSANGSLDFNPLFWLKKEGWLDITGRYVGSQASPINVAVKNSSGTVLRSWVEPNHRIDAVFLLNIGLHMQDLPKGLGLDLTINNLLGKKYEEGGSMGHPYPQEGRWFKARLSYTLHKI